MTQNSDIVVVVLAAGAASRFGSPKQMADIDGVAMVRHCAQCAASVARHIVVVTGAHRDDVDNALSGMNVMIVHNAVWPQGMGGSIATGVRTVVDRFSDTTAVIILLGDQPAVTPIDLQKLIAMHRAAPGTIVAARAADIVGPPCLFPRNVFDELVGLDNVEGARNVLRKHAECVIQVEIPNAGDDIDTMENYAAFVERLANSGGGA